MATTSVVYNSYTLPLLQGRFSFERSGKSFSFSQPFLVQSNTSDSDFNTKCQAAETALNQKDGALLVTWADQTYLDLDPADNTGMLTRGVVRKAGDSRKDQRRSRLYVLEVTGLLPASEMGYSGGGFEVEITMRMDASRRPVFIFTGEYRGESSSDALTTYTDGTNGGQALATAWLQTHAATIAGNSIYDGDSPLTNYELIAEDAPSEDQRKQLRYTLTYRYRIIPETAAGNASNLFTVENCTVVQNRDRRFGRIAEPSAGTSGGSRTAPAPGGGAVGGSDTPYTYVVEFEVSADLEQVIYDGSGARTSMESMYETIVKPFLWQHLQDTWNPNNRGPKLLVSESVPVMTSANRMRVAWLIETSNALGLYALTYATRIRKDRRTVYRKRADGKQHTYDSYSPGEMWTAVQTAGGTCLGGVDPAVLIPLIAGKWELRDQEVFEDFGQHHDVAGQRIEIKDFQVVRTYIYRDPAAGVNQGLIGGAERTLG